MVVNLNVLCKVQLNEIGKQIWLSQIDSLPEEVRTAHPEIEATIKSQIDDNDCVECELWGIMNVFGPYISPASSPFKVFTIELNKNPNFGNFFKQEAPTDGN